MSFFLQPEKQTTNPVINPAEINHLPSMETNFAESPALLNSIPGLFKPLPLDEVRTKMNFLVTVGPCLSAATWPTD